MQRNKNARHNVAGAQQTGESSPIVPQTSSQVQVCRCTSCVYAEIAARRDDEIDRDQFLVALRNLLFAPTACSNPSEHAAWWRSPLGKGASRG